MNKLTRAIAVALAAAALTAPSSGATPSIDRMATRLPKGYGTNPCITLMEDMANSRRVFDDETMDAYEHLIGCTDRDGDFRYTKANVNACDRAAYAVAKKLAPGGLLHEVEKVPHAVVRKLNSRTNDRCTLAEDWSWYDGDHPVR